jgi:peptide/nickel transport system substrate-binding protein
MKRNSHTRRLLLLVAVLLAAGLVWGLAEALAASSSPAPASGQVVLRIGWTSEPDNLNPFIGWANTDYEIWAINYDFLFGFGLNGQPTLDLASQFPTKANGGISADGKVWTIHLRPNLKWSDGQPLTAADVAFTYNYVVKNQMVNMAITTVNITGAKEIDPTTVQITCSRPKADMEKIFLPILPEHIWEHVSPSAAVTSYINKPPIVGSGPFYTVAFKKGSYLEMVRNPYYWGKQPTVDKIYFEMYQNADTMVSDLKSGALDAAWGIPEAQFQSLSTQPGLHTIAYNYFNWDYLNLNCYDKPSSMGNPVLRDVRFRDALNYAIDRQRLCDLAYEGLAAPATTILPPNTWFNPDYHWQPPAAQAYTFDLAKAGQLLTAAGYPLKNGVRLNKQGQPISLRLWATTDFPEAQIEAKLIAGWFQRLGLKIDLSIIDRGAENARLWNFKGNTYAPDFDMYVDDWLGYGDPGQTLTAETTAQIGYTNEPSWSDAAFDKLDAQQSSALDPTVRKNTIDKMQQIMYQQTPWVVLIYPEYLQAYNTARWTGWTLTLHGHGPAIITTGNVDTYLNLRPVVAKAGGGGGSGTTIVIVVAAAVVVVGAATWFVWRRRSRTEEA